MIRTRLLILASLAAVLPTLALAATPAPPKVTGYPVDVLGEVEVQNITCDELVQLTRKWVTGGYGVSMVDVAMDILNKPQHSADTSDTLFGPRLTGLIISASQTGVDGPTCTRITPRTWGPDPKACSGEPNISTRDLSMNDTSNPLNHPGELKLMNELERSAKLRNCQLP